jgi:AraC-like DNA-binding protein
MGQQPPVERVVFRNARVEVGAFRCPVGRPDFRCAGGPIADHHVFVFPRSRVYIRHEGEQAFATDRNVVALYNPGQRFERQPLDATGDFCDWFAVDAESALEAVRAVDPGVAERPQRCFRFSHGPSDARTYLAQRALFEGLVQGAVADELAVEEQVLLLLGSVVESCQRAWHGARRVRADLRAREAVRRARLILGERYREATSLAELAHAVGVSRFRLCRLFREATGVTLHAYREQLRLRAALDALATPGVDLTDLALELGYSSHSHFTSHFRRVFGLAPSVVRGRFARDIRERGPGARTACAPRPRPDIGP